MKGRSLKPIIRVFAINIFILVVSFASSAQDDRIISGFPDSMRVGVYGSPPFVMEGIAGPEGVSIDTWGAVANMSDVSTEYVPFNNIEDAFSSIYENKIDILVGPISINSQRLKKLDFSQPYFHTGLSILTSYETPTFWHRIKPIFSTAFLYAVGVFFLILGIVGSLLWIVEHKKSEQFSEKPLEGIGTGIWLALVTMTTVGYGDKAPITPKGRLVAGIWMIVSLLITTSLIASIASVLTLTTSDIKKIETIDDLRGETVATIINSDAHNFLENYGTSINTVNNLDKAYDLLQNNQVSAIVYDRPQLEYLLKERPSENLILTPREYRKSGYGFCYAVGSQFDNELNIQLMQLIESDFIRESKAKFLGEK